MFQNRRLAGYGGVVSKFFLLIVFVVPLSYSVKATDPEIFLRETSVSATYFRGFLYPHHEYIQFFNSEYINGVDIRFGKSFPNINSKRIPTIGLGGYMSNLGNTDIYGNVLSGYAYFTSPIVLHKGLSVGTNLGVGLGWVTKPNNPFTNPLNQAIGSHLNAFILLALDLRYKTNSGLSFFVGPSLMHSSNGKIRLPNTGLNIISLRLGADYIIRNEIYDFSQKVFLLNYEKRHRLNFLLSSGIQQDNKPKPITKGVWGLNTNYSYLLGKRGRAGAGVDLFYIPTEYKYYTENEVVINPSPWSGGVYLGYEIVWHKVSFVLQQGVRLFYENPYESDFYSRLGIRYRFAQRFVANCSLKTSRLVAEYVEWGIGYDLNF